MFSQNALVLEMGRLQKFALRLTRNKTDADDLVQSTCLQAIEKSDYFDDGTNLFGWTSKIMFNLFVSGYRRKAKFDTRFDPETYLEKVAVEATQDTSMELADVKRAIRQLNADHREILVLICVKGMRYEEVSALLQIPVGTVRSRLARARRQLQLAMDNTPPPIMALPQASAPIRLANNANMLPIVPAYIVSSLQKRRA